MVSPDKSCDTEMPAVGYVLTAHVIFSPRTDFHQLLVLEKISYLPFCTEEPGIKLAHCSREMPCISRSLVVASDC